MARDYRKLRTFQLADELALEVYNQTKDFPREEIYGLTSQIRRAALSVPTNIVEGSFRAGENEYLNFLNIALASAAEVGYLIHFAQQLDYLNPDNARILVDKQELCIKSLHALVTSLRQKRDGGGFGP